MTTQQRVRSDGAQKWTCSAKNPQVGSGKFRLADVRRDRVPELARLQHTGLLDYDPSTQSRMTAVLLFVVGSGFYVHSLAGFRGACHEAYQ